MLCKCPTVFKNEASGCGHVFEATPDEEGYVDCPECGMFFKPVDWDKVVPEHWKQATAFMIDGVFVTNDFRLYPEEDDDSVDMYVYGERGSKLELYLSADMLTAAKPTDNGGLSINYHGETFVVVPLFTKEFNHA